MLAQTLYIQTTNLLEAKKLALAIYKATQGQLRYYVGSNTLKLRNSESGEGVERHVLFLTPACIDYFIKITANYMLACFNYKQPRSFAYSGYAHDNVFTSRYEQFFIDTVLS
jgi:hypothetical protein